MGSWSKNRLESLYPSYSTGIDHAGPIMIKDRRGRGSKSIKCYVSICMATKAVHIEPVCDLKTEYFGDFVFFGQLVLLKVDNKTCFGSWQE